jgi:hypothetical protein
MSTESFVKSCITASTPSLAALRMVLEYCDCISCHFLPPFMTHRSNLAFVCCPGPLPSSYENLKEKSILVNQGKYDFLFEMS